MSTEGALVLPGARQVRAFHLCKVEVTAYSLGHVVHAERSAVLVDEDQLFGVGLVRVRLVRDASGDPLFERGSHARGEAPKAGVVRLVFVEAHGFVLKVDVFDLKGGGFLPAHPFPVKEGVEDAPLNRDGLALEQLLVLAGVQDGEPLAGARGGEPALRDGRALDVPGELGQVQGAIDENPIVPTGRRTDLGLAGGEGKVSHHLVTHGPRDEVHRNVADRSEAILFNASLCRI